MDALLAQITLVLRGVDVLDDVIDCRTGQLVPGASSNEDDIFVPSANATAPVAVPDAFQAFCAITPSLPGFDRERMVLNRLIDA